MNELDCLLDLSQKMSHLEYILRFNGPEEKHQKVDDCANKLSKCIEKILAGKLNAWAKLGKDKFQNEAERLNKSVSDTVSEIEKDVQQGRGVINALGVVDDVLTFIANIAGQVI